MDNGKIIDIKTTRIPNNNNYYGTQHSIYKFLTEEEKKKNNGFKEYLKNHSLTYKGYRDYWSIKIIEAVKLLYGYEWNRRLKPLISIFTIYVNWNLHTSDLDEYEVSFLVYQYLRYNAHSTNVRSKYNVLKKYLLEDIDEEDLDHWLMTYRETRLESFR